MELEFAPHVEEIKRALDNEVDESNITADLKKLLEYRVPLSEAKRSLPNHHETSETPAASKSISSRHGRGSTPASGT